MPARDWLRGILAGVLAGAAGGLFGVGGGIILVPLLTTFFGFSQHQAHGTSLAFIGPTALAGLLVYGASSQVDWSIGLTLAAASIVSARFGARWAAHTSPLALRRAFAVLLALVAARLLWQSTTVSTTPLASLARFAFALGLGVATGLFSGYFGVGGGLVAVPGLTLGLGMAQHAAQGTSLLMIALVAPMGALEHARHGNVVTRWVVPLALGGMAVGAPATAWLAQRVPHDALVRAFAVFLIVNAALSWRQGAARVVPSRGVSSPER